MEKRIRQSISVIFTILVLSLLSGCSASRSSRPDDTEQNSEAESVVGKVDIGNIDNLPLRDNRLLYSQDDDTGVVTMYLTVRRGNSSEGTDHSWEEINSYSAYYYEEQGIDRYQAEGILQVGDENGPVAGEVGFGEAVPNATVQIRGQTSSRNAQKNYKIHLKDNKGLWRQQQTINLNKHQTDGLRFRNKLCFDLLKEIPQISSLRTQFVHLYVKDETGKEETSFQDYGLYTQVEQMNKKGLRAHGFDPNAHLYKINFFEFFEYADIIKPMDDPSYDQRAFDKLLECKGNTDHTKLIQMLKAVNDYSIPAEELLTNYFNMENLVYWMAFNILTGNVDTQSRNFYLYSPQNSNTWYILPWDYDAAFKSREYESRQYKGQGSWESGVSNYWGNILFKRCLKSELFRNQLDAAIQEIKVFLSEDRLNAAIESYRLVTEPYLTRMPDQMYAPLTPAERDRIAKAIPGEVESNYKKYLESYQKPLPFYIGIPSVKDGKLSIIWDVSYDFQAEDITYIAEISNNYDMQGILASYEGVWPEMSTEMLPPGQYFVRVRSRDASGNEQDAFDYYVTEQGKEFGIKCFYILPDGSIEEDVYVE